MNPDSYLATAGLLASLALSSCSDSGMEPDPLEAQAAAAAAAVAADAVLEDLNVMSDAVPRMGGPAMMGGSGMMDGLSEHLVRERAVTFLDGNGLEQEVFDPISTATIHAVVTIEGEISRDNFSGSIERYRDMWVTGLEGEEATRTWNGDGWGKRHRVRVDDEFGERSYDVESTSLIEDVVRSVDREAQPWPLSGTITRNIEVTIANGPDGDMSRVRTVVITFNGTQFVTLTVDGEPSHEVDLETREGRNPLRRRER